MRRNGSRRSFVVATAVFAAWASSLAAARADDVRAEVKGTTLFIVGDTDGNHVSLTTLIVTKETPSPVSVNVIPLDATTLNGVAASHVFDGVVNVKVALGDGDDVLSCGIMSTPGSLTVSTGTGADTVTLQECLIDKNVKVLGTAGVLHFSATDSTVHGNLLVKGGNGDDVVSFDGGGVSRNTKILLGAGNNTFSASSINFSGNFLFKTSKGADEVTFDSAGVGDNAIVLLGPGANSFEAQDAQVGRKFLLVGGKDDDTVHLLGTSIGDGAGILLSKGTNNVVLDEFDPDPLTPGTVKTQVGEALLISGSSGNDTIQSDHGTQIGSSCRLTLSTGDNIVMLLATQVGTDLLVTAGSGDDSVDLTGTTVGRHQRIALDGGTNTGP